MRARTPDSDGFVESDGVKVGYEVFGSGAVTLLLMPTWTIVHTRFWKMQVPYLSDHFRVITFDRPGNGRSDRTLDAKAHRVSTVTELALAVLDATETERAVVLSLSRGAQEALKLSVEHPERVLGAVYIGNALRLEPGHPEHEAARARFAEPTVSKPHGWERLNGHYWLEHYDDFVDFFFNQCFPEAHSTKQIE